MSDTLSGAAAVQRLFAADRAVVDPAEPVIADPEDRPGLHDGSPVLRWSWVDADGH